MKRLILAMLAVFAIFAIAGCGGDSKAKKEADTEKWNSYIDISNSMKTVYKGLDGYVEVFGNELKYEQPKSMTKFLNAMSSGPEKDRVEKGLKKASELSAKGSTELDKTAAKTFAAMNELYTALADSYAYYRNKDYVDDNYAKAQKLHERVIKAYPAFEESTPVFNKIMDAEAKVRRKAEIKEMSAEGYKIRASMLSAIDAAKNMQDILIEQDITSQNLQSLKMDVFRPAYDEFVKALGEYDKVKDDKNQRKKEQIQDYSVESVAKCLKDVKASAAGLIERYQTKAAPPRMIPGSTTGTPENFDQKMDMLITRYNQSLR